MGSVVFGEYSCEFGIDGFSERVVETGLWHSRSSSSPKTGQWREGRNWVLRRFQQLRSYRDEIETRNREEIPYSSGIVPRGLSAAEGP